MSMFDLKGNSGSNNVWNYSDNSKANYAEWIQGTVVEISNPQARDFNTGKPAFWDDGNPKRNLMMTVLQADGTEINWIFSPKSKSTDACLAALDPNGDRDEVSIEEMLGKLVTVQTTAGSYNVRNPRPWWVTIHGDGQANMVRGLKDLSQPQNTMPGMPNTQPAPQPQAVPAPAPTALQQAQAAAQQAVAQQNFQPAPAPAPVATPPVPAPQVPAGTPVPTDAYGVYDEDIPF